MGKRKILVGFILVFTVTLSSFSFYFWQVVTSPNILVEQESRYIHIASNASFKDVQNTLYNENFVNDLVAFSFLAKLMDYDKFVKRNRKLWGNLMVESHNMLIDLKGEVTKPFSLKYLAEKQKE